MHFTDEGLNSIEKAADKQKNVCLLFLIDIYRMLKILVEKQNNTGNVSESTIEEFATEETLQSIDSTLKRIEELLSKENRIEIFAEEITNLLADSLEKAMPRT